jgi:F-type H+-transporting ATPase subunit c
VLSFSTVFLNNKKGDNKKMFRLKYVFFATLAIALMSVAVMGQAGAADNESTVSAAKAIGGGIGFGLAAGLAGIGQGLVGSRAAEGAARNPGAAGTVQTMMIIALALIESLVLFALLIVFVKL